MILWYNADEFVLLHEGVPRGMFYERYVRAMLPLQGVGGHTVPPHPRHDVYW